MRLSSIEPGEVTDEMISYIKNSMMICRHLHIPLQSGDNKILRLMKRSYDTGFFKDLTEKLLDAAPDMAIGTDIMVGFPGEGEKEFENTFKFVKEIPIAYFHVFPYSERPGTKSATLPDQVMDNIKKKRGNILRALGKNKRAAFAERFIGEKLSVLVEDKKDRETGLMKGFSGNYIPVLIINGSPSLTNNVVDVIADHTNGGKIFGRKTTNGQR